MRAGSARSSGRTSVAIDPAVDAKSVERSTRRGRHGRAVDRPSRSRPARSHEAGRQTRPARYCDHGLRHVDDGVLGRTAPGGRSYRTARCEPEGAGWLVRVSRYGGAHASSRSHASCDAMTRADDLRRTLVIRLRQTRHFGSATHASARGTVGRRAWHASTTEPGRGSAIARDQTDHDWNRSDQRSGDQLRAETGRAGRSGEPASDAWRATRCGPIGPLAAP